MPLKRIHIIGRASNQTLKILELNERDFDNETSLLFYLQRQNIPIASSCSSEGLCRMCIVTIGKNEQVLSCKFNIVNFLKEENFDITIYINYL